MKIILLLLLLFGCSSSQKNREIKDKVDSRVISMLQYLKIEDYTIVDEGERIEVVINVLEYPGRIQKIWIQSSYNEVNNLKIREIHSLAGSFIKPLDVNTANTYLKDNYDNRILGSWALQYDEIRGVYNLIYVVRLPYDEVAYYFTQALYEVAKVGDQYEQNFSDKDNF